jgi:hypothetical protein
MDQTAILQKAEANGGFVSQSMLEKESGWDSSRNRFYETLFRPKSFRTIFLLCDNG